MLEMKFAAKRSPALVETPAASVSSDAIAIRPLPPAARFSLRLDEAAAQEVGEAAGFALAIPLNSWRSVAEGRLSFRLGPNEWLLLTADNEAETVAREIAQALGSRFHAVVDIGHRNAAIEVSGRHAADVLNSGCPLDLSSTAFPAGTATRTLMGKAEIVLARIDDTPRYRVETWRSFAGYVHAFLQEGAREFAQPGH